MSKSVWRERAKPVIAEVLRRTQGATEKQIRRALREAYPFGSKSRHPYTIWLDEIKRQRGIPRLNQTRKQKQAECRFTQLSLFEDYAQDSSAQSH